MSTKTSSDLIESAGGARSEPGGRAQRPAGGEPLELAGQRSAIASPTR